MFSAGFLFLYGRHGNWRLLCVYNVLGFLLICPLSVSSDAGKTTPSWGLSSTGVAIYTPLMDMADLMIEGCYGWRKGALETADEEREDESIDSIGTWDVRCGARKGAESCHIYEGRGGTIGQ